jgi:hypothetical protein
MSVCTIVSVVVRLPVHSKLAVARHAGCLRADRARLRGGFDSSERIAPTVSDYLRRVTGRSPFEVGARRWRAHIVTTGNLSRRGLRSPGRSGSVGEAGSARAAIPQIIWDLPGHRMASEFGHEADQFTGRLLLVGLPYRCEAADRGG